jgi:hypothetical protein
MARKLAARVAAMLAALTMAALAQAATPTTAAGAPLPTSASRVFPDVLRPEAHPRYATVTTQPPTWLVFRNTTQFNTMRSFSQTPNNTVVDYQATLAAYAPLGSIVWPVYMTIFAPNWAQLVDYLATQGVGCTDLWGFVPGSGPGPEMWQAFTPPAANLAYATTALGDSWFGMDVGEQDGRFVGGYADQGAPLDAPPVGQLAYFDAHFTAMQDQLGGRVVGLTSLTFPHYMAASGMYTMLGCEAAM